eukprot:SAG25_NODE_13365_length_268_cov_0.609467_1_plen_28_part_01
MKFGRIHCTLGTMKMNRPTTGSLLGDAF